MFFYIFLVLLPAILFDIPITNSLIEEATSEQNHIKRHRYTAAFSTVPLYLISAVFWILVFGFQGQAVLGSIVFMGCGIVFAFLRLLLGIMLLINLRRR
jgi:ABC-type branched-subunit amino acid transport system permease subunit